VLLISQKHLTLGGVIQKQYTIVGATNISSVTLLNNIISSAKSQALMRLQKTD
jgi:hypothetical protein